MIPSNHSGMDYNQFIPTLLKKRGARRYLEIGVSQGQLMSRVSVDTAIGVDPFFQLTQNVAAGKNSTTLIQASSDNFFSDYEPTSYFGGPPDFVFLDGFHTFEFLLRDFYNVEAIASEQTLIVLHDCLPLSEEMVHRNEATSQALSSGKRFEGYWTGDVWKILPILMEYRPDLQIVCVDSQPTGLVCLTGLNPSSTILKSKYLEIVKKYGEQANDLASLNELYSRIQVIDATLILNDFDHSLYFRT